MRVLKNIVFFTLLGLLCLPLLQQVFKPFEEIPLSGAYHLPDTVPLTIDNWTSGQFQEKYSPFYEYDMGFRPSFVRLRNQLYYWTYHKSTNYISVGKEDQLFAWNYWAPYWGLDLVPDDTVTQRVNRIFLLKQKLDSMGVPLLVVIGANKVRYMPEYLPDGLQREERLPNNYRNYLPALTRAGIPVVDFNEVFIGLKPEIGRAMFPNTGTHWSAYGMGMCLDSIISFTDRKRNGAINDLAVNGFIKRDSIVESDIDLSNDLNLWYPIKRQQNLFPNIEVKNNGRKAKLFVIGDSFYWNLYQLEAFYEVVDSSSHYWYYNNTDIAFDGTRHPVEEYDAVKLASEADAVILLATEANLHLFPFEFPEEFLIQLSTGKGR